MLSVPTPTCHSIFPLFFSCMHPPPKKKEQKENNNKRIRHLKKRRKYLSEKTQHICAQYAVLGDLQGITLGECSWKYIARFPDLQLELNQGIQLQRHLWGHTISHLPDRSLFLHTFSSNKGTATWRPGLVLHCCRYTAWVEVPLTTSTTCAREQRRSVSHLWKAKRLTCPWKARTSCKSAGRASKRRRSLAQTPAEPGGGVPRQQPLQQPRSPSPALRGCSPYSRAPPPDIPASGGTRGGPAAPLGGSGAPSAP